MEINDLAYNARMDFKKQFTGNLVDVNGIIMVFYFGVMIAAINNLGEIIVRDYRYPLYLIEYLIQQPTHENAKWN